MTEFDYQWRNLPSKDIEYNDDRVTEFLEFTNLDVVGKYCLDVGCGNGRYTYAMLKLGAIEVDAFDISTEAIAKCKNGYVYVYDIMDLKPNSIYDFVLCWGLLHHLSEPRKAFSKLVSQVKSGGILHIMVYNKDAQKLYEEDRGVWSILSLEEKLNLCHEKVRTIGGTIHGWFDALNPKYNWGFTIDEVKKWFEEEGFKNIRIIMNYNINIQGEKPF